MTNVEVQAATFRNVRISRLRSSRLSRSIHPRRVAASRAKAGIYLKVVINALEQSGYNADDFDGIYEDLDS